MRAFLKDLRLALRTAVKTPVLSIIATLTIALGIGANSAVFSLLGASLFRSPFVHPENLVSIFNRFPNLERGPASFPDFVEWRRQSRTFDKLAAYFLTRPSFAGRAEPRRISGSLVSQDYFQTLGVSARLGRIFALDEHLEGAPQVCVISDAFWRREFQADPGILRRTAIVDGVAYSIVGVLAPETPSFSYPQKTDVWIPLEPRAPFKTRGNNYLDIVGRLKSGTPLARASAELGAIQAGINQDFPENQHGLTLLPLLQALFGDTRPVLVVLLAAAAGIILIACSNLANLLLARGAERGREFAIRQALGADRSRIVRQLLAEGLLIPAVGGALGVFFALLAGKALIAAAPAGMRLPDSIELDWPMAGFSLALILATALISGVVPSIRGSRVGLNEALRGNAHQVTGSAKRLGARHRFVMAEIALATVLLAGSFLAVESLWRLVRTNPGFNPEKLLTMQIALDSSRYSQGRKQAAFFEDLLKDLRTLPGATAAGAITNLPIGQGGTTGDFEIEGRPKPSGAKEIFAAKEIVTPGYFEAMKIPLVAGRFFTERDRAGAPKTVIISQKMAKQFWPGENPIGRRIDLGMTEQDEWDEIVGVVGDVRAEGLNVPPSIAAYLCASQYPSSAMAVVVRSGVDPLGLASAARAAVYAIDPQQAVSDLTIMDQVLRQSVSQPRSLAYLLSAFAAIALLLAAIGIYGLVQFSVTQRTQEIGIRMALGADRIQVLRSILGSGMRLLVIGLGVGLVLAVSLTQLLRGLLFGASPLDPLAFLSVTATLALVSVLACYIPARRAASIDPIRALRDE